MPSWAFLLIIVLGGAAVVIANIKYPAAKAEEDKLVVATKAQALIDPEIRTNINLAEAMLSELQTDHIVFETMSVAAWETISKGNLLAGFDAEYIGKVMRFYKIVYDINAVNARLIDMSTGVYSVLTDNREWKSTFKEVLSNKILALQKAGKDLSLPPATAKAP